MDGLSAFTTALTVVQTAWQAYDLCRTYYSEVKEARSDIQRLRQEMVSLEIILTSVSDLAKDPDSGNSSNVGHLTEKDGPLQQCHELLKKLVAKLSIGEGKKRMRHYGMRALKWPLNSKDIEKFQTSIERHKATFTAALTVKNV